MKISVCIPTYNQAAFIKQSVESAFKQDVPPFEIIVSNDCSTDNTKEVLENLCSKIPNLTVINQPANLGIAKNTDACLRLASGKYIVRLDSDDFLSTSFIKKLSELLDANENAGYAHAAVQEIDSQGSLLKQRRLIRKSGFQSAEEALKASLTGYRVAANIVMFRKEALERVDFLKERPNFGEDYHLTAAISASGFGNVYLDETLSFYRVWLDAAKVRQKRKLSEINGLKRVFEEVIEPAFKERGWSLSGVNRSKTDFACTQADCLGWKMYNNKEKKELVAELKKLSSAPKARLYAMLYLKDFGGVVNFFSKIISLPKAMLKIAYLRFRA